MRETRILLADDHAIVREGLRLLLEAHPDIEVIGEAGNGRDALKQARTFRPDIVILDVAMPELNGIDVAERIYALDPSMRTIILSMYSTKDHIYRALRAGASGYLLKEAAASELLVAVWEVRAGRRYISSKVSDEIDEGLFQQDPNVDIATPLERLSSREREVLQLVAEGKSSIEIGKVLFLSSKTVDTYRSRLMRKLQLADIASLVRFAIQHGIVSAE